MVKVLCYKLEGRWFDPRSSKEGGRNKAPGSDGIGLEFYTTNWKIIKEDIVEILNQMFLQRSITL